MTLVNIINFLQFIIDEKWKFITIKEDNKELYLT